MSSSGTLSCGRRPSRLSVCLSSSSPRAPAPASASRRWTTSPTCPRRSLAAQAHDPKVIVEAGVVGREIECAVLGGRDGGPARASQPGEIVVTDSRHGFYDFEAKYLDEAGVQLSCPADLPDDLLEEVRRLAVRTFDAVGCEGLARVDVFVTPDDGVVVNEINTMPGFTPFSMYPRMWQASGMAYPDLIDELLTLALARPTGLR